MNIQPLGNRVVIKPLLDNEEKTKSGIIIPDTIDKEKPEQGTVLAVGRGKIKNGELIPLEVKVGDVVLFTKYGPDEVIIDGEKYLVLTEDNVLAVLQ